MHTGGLIATMPTTDLVTLLSDVSETSESAADDDNSAGVVTHALVAELDRRLGLDGLTL